MKKRLLATLAVGAATVFALAACTPAGSTTSTDSSSSSTGSDKTDLKIAVFSGWAEGEAASYLWQQVLNDKGYNVTLDAAAAGPVFTGLSQGDYDVTFDVWLPSTHKTYWAKYGAKLEDLGAWYKNAPLTVAVNKNAPIDSLADLAPNADKFDNKIIGIEPGAGLTGVMNDSVIPDYKLSKMQFQTSSTAAMLAALKKASKDGTNIAVTLWRPHWAYSAFPIKDLKDPKGALGKPDHIDTVGRTGFATDYPQVTKWMKNFTFPDAMLADLENAMFNSGADESAYPKIVKKWMGTHKEFVDGLTS
jgi:glycine betaine/proline transport system substrate-binding protein